MLVVIGVIGLMISLLLPALNKAQAQAQKVTCMSNMRQVGQAMLIYAEQYNGYLFPPNKGWRSPQPPYVDGTNPPQYDVWPFYLFKAGNPSVMLCPSDFQPAGNHSYFANAHLLPGSMDLPANTPATPGSDIKYSSPLPTGRTPSDVIVMGEKVTSETDYYMDLGDFDTKVEQFRHGPLLGSNYLMLDMHVETCLPTTAWGGLDPWDLNGIPTTQSTQ
jgi:type II secretory pathway pseudopilin PulG